MKKLSHKQLTLVCSSTLLALLLATAGPQVLAEENGQVVFDSPQQGEGSALVQNPASDQLEEAVAQNEAAKPRGFYQDEAGNWRYADETGQDITGLQLIDGATYYFNNEGIQIKGQEVWIDGQRYYFDAETGLLWTNRFRELDRTTYINGSYDENWVYYGADGARVKGFQTIDGIEYHFNDWGIQSRYKILDNGDGTSSYFGPDGIKVYGNWGKIRLMYLRGYITTATIYLDENGHLLTDGVYELEGKLYYFNKSGLCLYADYSKGIYLVTSDMLTYGQAYPIIYQGQAYIFSQSGELIPNTLFKNQYRNYYGDWYYLDAEGQVAKGAQTVNGSQVYFDPESGVQVKGRTLLGSKPEAENYYYDADTGEKWTNHYLEYDGLWYYLDDDGNPLIGSHQVDGAWVYFHPDGHQAKGEVVRDQDGSYRYYDADSGELVKNKSLILDFDEDGRGQIRL